MDRKSQVEFRETHLRAAAVVECKKQNNFTAMIRERNAEFAKIYNGNRSEDLVKEIYLPTTALFSDVEGRFRTKGNDIMDFVHSRSLGENITLTTSDLEVVPS